MSKTDEPELDGMPNRDVRQTIEYTLKRGGFVSPDERLDVGDVVKDLTPGWFRIERVTHTKVDRIDVYTLKATEIT